MLQLTEEHDRMIAETRGAEKEAHAVLESERRLHESTREAHAIELKKSQTDLVQQAAAAALEVATIKDQAQATWKLAEEARLQDKKQVEEMRRALQDAEAVRDAALAARDEAVADAALACQAMANKDKIWETTQRSLAGLPRRVREDHLEIREVLASEGAWRSIGRAATQQQLEAPDRITASANPAKPRMRTLPTGVKTEETNVGGLLNDWKAEARMRFLQSVASQGAPHVSLIKPSGDP